MEAGHDGMGSGMTMEAGHDVIPDLIGDPENRLYVLVLKMLIINVINKDTC